MGLFDLPGVILDLLQAILALVLPDGLSLLLWAFLAAFLSMWIYGRFSDQTGLAGLKPRQRDARDRLARYDGPFEGLAPLIRENLRLSGQHMWLTLLPTLLASLPLLFMLPWLSNTFAMDFPAAGTPITLTLIGDTTDSLRPTSSDITAVGPDQWRVTWPNAPEDLSFLDDSGNPVLTLALPPKAPSPILHKRRWWNLLLANPAGYLPAEGTLDSLLLELPARRFIPVGPDWLQGWLATFLLALVIFSLFFKWRWKLR